MPPEPLIDEDYASEDDSDFAPGGVQADDESEQDSESEAEAASRRKPEATRKRKHAGDDELNASDFENSGDETIIQKGQKRQSKKAKKAADSNAAADDDGGGEGGFIKTRRQRAQEKAERKLHAVTGNITVDVDALWSQMIATPLIPSKAEPDHDKENQRSGSDGANNAKTDASTKTAGPSDGNASEMIKIKRTYNFAGKVHTEEKLVARDSAEGQLYLASLDPNAAETEDGEDQPRRKPRKAFRSVFEPAVEGLTERADLKLGMNARLQIREQQAKAKKLNVVEKSRMDWAGFVDKEGIKDELALAGKSKESYVNRQDFLRRVEANKEEEARRARMAGRG